MAESFKDIDCMIKNNPLLEELYYMMCNHADFTAPNQEIEEHWQLLEQKIRALERNMDCHQKEKFNQLSDVADDHLSIHIRQSFIFGYKVAQKLLNNSKTNN